MKVIVFLFVVLFVGASIVTEGGAPIQTRKMPSES